MSDENIVENSPDDAEDEEMRRIARDIEIDRAIEMSDALDRRNRQREENAQGYLDIMRSTPENESRSLRPEYAPLHGQTRIDDDGGVSMWDQSSGRWVRQRDPIQSPAESQIISGNTVNSDHIRITSNTEQILQFHTALDQSIIENQLINMEEAVSEEPVIVLETEDVIVEEKSTKASDKKEIPKEEIKSFEEKVKDICLVSFTKKDVYIGKQIANGGSEYYGLTIRWPFVEMHNNEGVTHSIKDMMVFLPFDREKKHFGYSLYGTRGIVNVDEQQAGYRHSHIYSGMQGFTEFCTGSDGINDTWTFLKLTDHTDENFDMKFESFLHQLEAFISYESIEGTPHIYIKDIHAAGQARRRISSDDIRRESRIALSSLRPEDIELSMDFNNGNVRLVETDHFHSLLASVVTIHQKRTTSGIFVNLNSNVIRRSSEGRHLSNTTYLFHDERKEIWVEPYNNGQEEEEQKEKKYAHQSIIEYVKQSLESRGSEKLRAFCKEKTIHVQNEEERQNGHWKKFDYPNFVLLGEKTKSRVVRAIVLANERRSESQRSRNNTHPF